jgi:hypothetical protein
MPDEPVTDAVETTPPDESPAEQAPKPTETVDFWKSKAREQEKRAKENADAAKELEAIRESQKSDQQRLVERAEAAERERDEERALRQVGDWKSEVAKKTGVPAEVLRGSSLEDIEAHAVSLKALLPEPRPGHVPTEGRTVTTGSGDPAQQFASLISNQLRNA